MNTSSSNLDSNHENFNMSGVNNNVLTNSSNDSSSVLFMTYITLVSNIWGRVEKYENLRKLYYSRKF